MALSGFMRQKLAEATGKMKEVNMRSTAKANSLLSMVSKNLASQADEAPDLEKIPSRKNSIKLKSIGTTATKGS